MMVSYGFMLHFTFRRLKMKVEIQTRAEVAQAGPNNHFNPDPTQHALYHEEAKFRGMALIRTVRNIDISYF